MKGAIIKEKIKLQMTEDRHKRAQFYMIQIHLKYKNMKTH